MRRSTRQFAAAALVATLLAAAGTVLAQRGGFEEARQLYLLELEADGKAPPAWALGHAAPPEDDEPPKKKRRRRKKKPGGESV